ncbi:MAG: twin-arginine translocase subunit TatC [Patescibacteria group bacterium]
MSKVAAGQHLKELRTRLLIVALFFIVGACLAYAFQPQVVDAVLAPLKGETLIYLNPAGGFNFIFLISIYAGLALAIPILIQQLYAFIRPALPPKGQKRSSTLIIGSFILLLAGILFGYFVAVPNALTFLYSFADSYIDASLTAESYLNFIIAYTIGIGLVFQIPLLLLLVNSIKPLTPGGLMKSEKWVLLISVVIAAIITPTPDPVNQLLIAGPVIIVYQIGVVIILMSLHKKYRANKRELKQAARTKVKATPIEKPTQAPEPKKAPQPVLHTAATTHPVKPQPQQVVKPRQSLGMDGFVRAPRPAVQPIVIPKREAPKTQPAVRTVPRPPSPNQRNFTIDGMHRPMYNS